jgi:hypothetical protein
VILLKGSITDGLSPQEINVNRREGPDPTNSLEGAAISLTEPLRAERRKCLFVYLLPQMMIGRPKKQRANIIPIFCFTGENAYVPQRISP